MSQTPPRESYSAVLITQGERKFYTLTLESDILSQTCVASPRVEDPEKGFQRTLDLKRAESIRDYIEQGGVIPGSIVLSAQDAAHLAYDGKKKTIQFNLLAGAFLIIDGQHRVFGFRLSKKRLRVPVVIFSGLSKRDEARLFIDINTLQKSVPNELLLDIKKLAETEKDEEMQVRYLFDNFHSDSASFLFGFMSPAEKSANKITRSTFLNSFKPLIKQYAHTEPEKLYKIYDSYLYGLSSVMPDGVDLKELITKPLLFRTLAAVFPDAARLVGFKHNKSYTPGNFEEVLKPFRALKKTVFLSYGSGHKQLAETLVRVLDQANNEL